MVLTTATTTACKAKAVVQFSCDSDYKIRLGVCVADPWSNEFVTYSRCVDGDDVTTAHAHIRNATYTAPSIVGVHEERPKAQFPRWQVQIKRIVPHRERMEFVLTHQYWSEHRCQTGGAFACHTLQAGSILGWVPPLPQRANYPINAPLIQSAECGRKQCRVGKRLKVSVATATSSGYAITVYGMIMHEKGKE